MSRMFPLFLVILTSAGTALGQDDGFVSAGREAALGAVQADRAQSQSPEMLANEYAFQYRQMTQERLNKIFQNSAGSVRQVDPFGTAMGTALRQQTARSEQDEGAEQEADRQAREGFGSAVRGLDVRGVNPGRKEFLCGADNIFEGDVLDVSFGSGIYRAWVVSVKPDSITFMDHVSQQTETIPISLDAPSMTPRNWGPSGSLSDAPPF